MKTIANFAFYNGTPATPNAFSSEPAMLERGVTPRVCRLRGSHRRSLYTRVLCPAALPFLGWLQNHQLPEQLAPLASVIAKLLALDWLELQSKLQLSACTRLISCQRGYEFGRWTSISGPYTARAAHVARTQNTGGHPAFSGRVTLQSQLHGAIAAKSSP